MMRWTRNMVLVPVLMVQALSSCSLIDEPVDEGGQVDVSLAFSVSNASGATTRMADGVVQETAGSYRSLGTIYLIPFAISGTQVVGTDNPSRLFEDASLVDSFSKKDISDTMYGGFYLYNAYSMVRGINAFLVYGRPPVYSSEKAINGALKVPDLVYPDLTKLSFALEPIYPNKTAPVQGDLLAGYLTYIARANTGEDGVSWSTTTDETLKLIYKIFTGQEIDGTMILAGASVNVMAHVNALYDLISALSYNSHSDEGKLKTAILKRIKDYSVEGLTLTTDTNGRLTGLSISDYPASLGLPDGAAALRWAKKTEEATDYEFVPQTVTTTLANVNNIDRFCYPAELFYYANSRIYTSNEPIKTSDYSDWDDWDALLNSKYKIQQNAMVTGNTQAVAIQKPLQYAVGRLKATLQKVTTADSKLTDNAGKKIALVNSKAKASFPLTGIIICNQHPVGFDFKPAGEETHSNDSFIYDSQVGSSCSLSTANDQTIPSTLVLQTYDNEKVIIALEFRNDSGEDFRSKSGVIYPGTKFYLMGEINPSQGTSTDTNVQGRVFTQDYITTVRTTVESLANAYNVLPNVLGGRLELGVELTPKWIQSEPTSVIID